MPGILYIVATPIGNLDDMPPRVAATFGAADFVAAEDTRVTLKLLNHLGLKKPMMSYYEHALHHGAAILDRIEAGESCALCSDAGMPCISDPGEQIVKDAIARGITVTPVPGASACVTALAVSGQDTARFVFEGFLPVPKKERRERLEFLQGETRTVIFYEAPHKLRGTLDDLCAAFGAERSITLCRELTKLHEEIIKTTIGEAVRYYEQNDPRGEYVLVMAGAPAAQAAAEEVTLPDAVATARLLMAQGTPPAAAAQKHHGQHGRQPLAFTPHPVPPLRRAAALPASTQGTPKAGIARPPAATADPRPDKAPRLWRSQFRRTQPARHRSAPTRPDSCRTAGTGRKTASATPAQTGRPAG